MNTGWGTSHTRACQQGGPGGGIALGEIPNVDDQLMGTVSRYGTCYINKPAHSAHLFQNLKYNFKKRWETNKNSNTVLHMLKWLNT